MAELHLALLSLGPAHGYDLKRAYDAWFPDAKPLAFGQVYAVLMTGACHLLALALAGRVRSASALENLRVDPGRHRRDVDRRQDVLVAAHLGTAPPTRRRLRRTAAPTRTRPRALTVLVGLASLLGVSFVSALTPFVNAEAALVATQALRHPLPLLPSAFVAAVGQMGAKYLYFRLGWWRSTKKEKPLPRWQQRLNAWSEAALTRGRWRGILVIALSSSVGLPPLLLVSVSAGLARMRTLDFLVVGVAGRFVRFAAILLGAGSVLEWLHVPGIG